MSFCAQQVSLRVCWNRPGRPAALFVQFGGQAREGCPASGEPASCQRVRPLHILWRRCPGPKVKTIPSCTSLPTHSCTVTIILLFFYLVLVGLLLICCLLNCFFLSFFVCLFISLYLGSPHSLDKMGAVGVRRCVCVRVCFHKQSLSHCVLGVCVAPQQITQRGHEVV